MKGLLKRSLLLGLMLTGCTLRAVEPPSQVIYRFDDHRYLELKGWNCEGELFYVDTLKGIRSEPYSQFYQAFGGTFIHPSERYIALTSWEVGGFTVSKDFGKTWHDAKFAPTFGSVEKNGDNNPDRRDVLSFTVVNDQGFLLTRQGNLYMSSKPFNDSRLAPGGPGIDYVAEGTKFHIGPQFPGQAWGLDYFAPKALDSLVEQFKSNYQNLPTKVPEVKNYTGWDHMQCDPDKGLH